MKILINDWTADINEKRQELPDNTLIEFVTERGDKLRIQTTDDKQGIAIHVVRATASYPLRITPRSGNSIEVY